MYRLLSLVWWLNVLLTHQPSHLCGCQIGNVLASSLLHLAGRDDGHTPYGAESSQNVLRTALVVTGAYTADVTRL